MKKILGLTLMLIFIASNCFAMTFSQPEKIGEIFWTPSSGIILKGYSYNSGNQVGKFQNEQTYRNGIARFGDEKTGIYFIYKTDPPYFGGKDKNFKVIVMVNTYIQKISNDENISLYLLKNCGSDIRVTNYTLIGYNKNGDWVKYFDTDEIKKRYFGDKGSSFSRLFITDLKCNENTIFIYYERFDPNLRKNVKVGEFRFKWDEAAQWFGVEHIVY